MTAPRTIVELAAEADDAARTATAIAQFSESQSLSIEEAYEVQDLSFARRIERGEEMVGIKMGFTSKAKMIQMGVEGLIWGRLSSAMRVVDGGEVSLREYVHPRVEPEIAFIMRAPLSGNVSAAEAMSAVEAVAPAVEIIDSRFENFKFSLADVVADNSSSSGFVIGDWFDPHTRIGNLGMVLEKDGRPVQIGSSAAILGDPVRSLVEASRIVGESGLRLLPGWIVLAGGATAAVALETGSSYRNVVENLGSVGFSVVD